MGAEKTGRSLESPDPDPDGGEAGGFAHPPIVAPRAPDPLQGVEDVAAQRRGAISRSIPRISPKTSNAPPENVLWPMRFTLFIHSHPVVILAP